VARRNQIRPMAEACKAASINDGSFHILRHTAASHMVMAGVPLNVVAHNLGHADTRMTEKHYAHSLRLMSPKLSASSRRTLG
jgi:integrase